MKSVGHSSGTSLLTWCLMLLVVYYNEGRMKVFVCPREDECNILVLSPRPAWSPATTTSTSTTLSARRSACMFNSEIGISYETRTTGAQRILAYSSSGTLWSTSLFSSFLILDPVGLLRTTRRTTKMMVPLCYLIKECTSTILCGPMMGLFFPLPPRLLFLFSSPTTYLWERAVYKSTYRVAY